MNKLEITRHWGRRSSALVLAMAFIGFASTSSAITTVVVNENPGTTQSIVGITGFSTTGDQMAGMVVTAFFDNGESASGIWAADGPGSGSASGSTPSELGFLLTQSGDTFTQGWTLTNTSPSEIGITRLLIDGIPGGTVFDRTFGGVEGTPSSALGADFSTGYTLPGIDFTVTALYQDRVAVNGFGPVGDLFRYLDIDLGMPGGLFNFDDPFTFVADTDSVGLGPQVAEPGSLLLLGAGLVGIWLRRRS
jgi:hypothetical protein